MNENDYRRTLETGTAPCGCAVDWSDPLRHVAFHDEHCELRPRPRRSRSTAPADEDDA